jgi:hypothetical protein
MVLMKLQEALSEADNQLAALEKQREALIGVQSQIRSMIASLSGATVMTAPPAPVPVVQESRDRLDELADILRPEGRPLHITVLCERLSAIRGETIDRTQVEPGLNRHVASAKKKRIEKFGPSMFGLPEWKPDAQQSLTEVA